MAETSPYDGSDGLRYSPASDGSPTGAMVFSSSGNPVSDAMAYIAGFMRPGGNPDTDVASGMLPGIVNIQSTAGDTVGPTVAVTLTNPEKQLISKWPTVFKAVSNNLVRFKWIVWPLVFFALFFLFRRLLKK